MNLRTFLFGRPIRDEDAKSERLGPVTGVPVLGLDALASAAYGPEAALTVLLGVGALATTLIRPILAVIVVILVIVYLSYRQTISAYPNGGGSYTVARENLGHGTGLWAAAALSLDYVLNVAVAISAGVGAVVSAIPALLPLTLPFCLLLVGLLTVVNLRGLRTAGALFVLPTYAFVASLGAVLVIGVVKTVIAGGHPAPVVPPPPLAPAAASASLWILLRSFANGCTAMTGVEAVSNAVPVFREPRTRSAERTLGIIILLLVCLLCGIGVLSHAYGVGATEPGKAGFQSVLSQLTGAVVGRGPFYGITMTSIFLVLCLSANTSFADFPRVCRVLALDGILPVSFAHSGRRLVYGTGIVVLAGFSTLLLIVFGGVTDRLIPLFAVGALGAFTLSQSGMVLHWHRSRAPRRIHSMVLNGVGALTTGATLLVVLVSKFTEGAWLAVIFVPGVVLLLRHLHLHYARVHEATSLAEPLDLSHPSPPIVIVPIRTLDKVVRKALRFATSISPEVHAVQVQVSDLQVDDLRSAWDRDVCEPARRSGVSPPELVVLESHYRELTDPLLDYLRRLARSDPDRFLAVLVPEYVERRWYHFLLHSHAATTLKLKLLFDAVPQVIIISAPWRADESRRRIGRRAPERTRSPERRTGAAEDVPGRV